MDSITNRVTYRVVGIIIISFISMFVCQILKILIVGITKKKWKWKLFFCTGGMPSSHSGTIMAMVSSLGILQVYYDGGVGYSFAVAAAFAVVVMYDAMGVRYEAGRHAKILNEIIENNPDLKQEAPKELKEWLGHKPTEVVAGAIIGVIVGLLGAIAYVNFIGK